MQVFNNVLSDSLSKGALDELKAALCSQGARTGLIKKQAPAAGKPGHIGWQAIMGELAPVRVSVWALISATDEQKALFDECASYCRIFHELINIQLQRPFEFNLYHSNH